MDTLFNISDNYINEDNEETNNPEDEEEGDLVDQETLNKLFKINYQFQSQISLNRNIYVMNLDKRKNILAGSLSNKEIPIFDLNSLKKIIEFKEHKSRITYIKFSSSDDNLLYSSSEDGTIKIWDLRIKECTGEFLGNKTMNGVQYTSFDTSSSGRYICAGTDLLEQEAYLLFWDLRNNKLLGGYSQCHNNPITQVRFHPTSANLLLSGSTDGLINLYDISQENEDNALQSTLNTNCSVKNINWQCNDEQNTISCITDNEDLQFWKTDESKPYMTYERDLINSTIRRSPSSYTYLVNIHNTKDGFVLLAGSSTRYDECLRSMYVKKNKLLPAAIFYNNKQMIRDSIYDEEVNIYITGGESGLINIWKQEEHVEGQQHEGPSKHCNKIKNKSKKKSSKPY